MCIRDRLRYTQRAITFFTHPSGILSYSFASFFFPFSEIVFLIACSFYVIKFIHMQIACEKRKQRNLGKKSATRSFCGQGIHSIKYTELAHTGMPAVTAL